VTRRVNRDGDRPTPSRAGLVKDAKHRLLQAAGAERSAATVLYEAEHDGTMEEPREKTV
jgi:hypothetical protein